MAENNPSAASRFPVDDATLIMLNAACEMNPDLGRTTLFNFLSMGEPEPTKTTLISESGGLGDLPIYEVEYQEGQSPFTVHEVIQALVAEIQRLRFVVGALGGGEDDDGK